MLFLQFPLKSSQIYLNDVINIVIHKYSFEGLAVFCLTFYFGFLISCPIPALSLLRQASSVGFCLAFWILLFKNLYASIQYILQGPHYILPHSHFQQCCTFLYIILSFFNSSLCHSVILYNESRTQHYASPFSSLFPLSLYVRLFLPHYAFCSSTF